MCYNKTAFNVKHKELFGMPIFYNDKDRAFKLRANGTDYMMKIVDDGYLAHVYYGSKIADEDLTYLLRLDESPFTPATNNRDKSSFMDTLPFEYPCFGIGDYRDPAFKILDEAGMSACDLRYLSHKIYKGKPKLEGLPATFDTENSPADTLEITLLDKHASLEVTLVYTAFEKLDVITRSVVVKNVGDKSCQLTRVLSACVDFDELIDIITLKLSELESMEDIEKVFSLFIGEDNLDKIEFKHIKKACPVLTDEEIKEMIEKADSDKDGKINFEDFYKIITKKI